MAAHDVKFDTLLLDIMTIDKESFLFARGQRHAKAHTMVWLKDHSSKEVAKALVHILLVYQRLRIDVKYYMHFSDATYTSTEPDTETGIRYAEFDGEVYHSGWCHGAGTPRH